MVTVTAAKRIRALLQNQPERQQKQAARVELRKRIRDQGIALTERMDHERTLHLRADTPMTARVAADMGAPPPPLAKPPPPARGPPPAKRPPPAKPPGAKAKALAKSQPPPSAPRSRSPPPKPPMTAKAPAKAPAKAAPPTTQRSRSPPARAPPNSGVPMSTGSAAPMNTGSSIGSAARAAMFQIGTPRAASSLSSISRSRSGYTASMHSRSPSTAGSVGSLIRRFEGLGHPGGKAPPMRPVRRQRDLNRGTR